MLNRINLSGNGDPKSQEIISSQQKRIHSQKSQILDFPPVFHSSRGLFNKIHELRCLWFVFPAGACWGSPPSQPQPRVLGISKTLPTSQEIPAFHRGSPQIPECCGGGSSGGSELNVGTALAVPAVPTLGTGGHLVKPCGASFSCSRACVSLWCRWLPAGEMHKERCSLRRVCHPVPGQGSRALAPRSPFPDSQGRRSTPTAQGAQLTSPPKTAATHTEPLLCGIRGGGSVSPRVRPTGFSMPSQN